ncbi:dedicator of cytokinesis protein 9 isoform X2 [Anopheles maculipalpis]|uniref:dedicator of cytokinesis protein 9 isoform X2 n=1 Tax=Anopheles maculipalpis TaxID=1496333 RepID=UPI002158C5A8|nr:dedicator of cytokinesis protein 9 isoform X2 [Anopheles maculipalpis]
MTERKFTRGLNKPGMAAQLRENISQVVRESTSLTKPIIVEPIDFEAFVLKNRTLIQNDPQRELLLYPTDDVSEILQPKKFRTVHSNIPGHVSAATSTSNGSSKRGSESGSASSSQNGTPNSNRSQSSTSASCGVSTVGGLLLTRQALHTYDSPNHLIHYKYSKYGGTCYDLPRISSPSEEMREEVYEVDTDPDRLDEQMTRSQADTIAKQGYLFKGPDTNSDRMFAHIGSKSFKKRYCYLRQEIDGTYILELHKDEKQAEAKATIVMDFCTEVVPNPKKGRFCFELKMKMNEGQHGKSVTLAADDESEMEDWLRKISSVLQQNKLQEDKRVASLERTAAPPLPASPSTMQYGTLKGLEQSMNPQLNRYARETDQSIAQARRDSRKRLFGGQQLLYLQSGGNVGGGMKAALSAIGSGTTAGLSKSEAFIEPYRVQFGQRILIKCDSLRFRLLGPIDGVDGPPPQDSDAPLCQIEPYLTSVALYDARAGRKLSENFYFDLNKDHVRELLTGSCKAERPHCASPKSTNKSHQNGNGTLKPGRAKCDTSDELQLHSEAVTKEWLARAKQAVFNVTVPHADIFIVVRIDKILQGAINPSVEPYLKTTKDPKVLCKLQKTIKQYAQKCGHYRMPFAWAARPLFQLYSNDLDTSYEFPAIYRQEGAKLKDEELLKLLSEYRKPDKFSKLTVIPGSLKIYIEALNELPNNCLTNSLVPLNPFPIPPAVDPTIEVTEFGNNSEQYLHPFVHFVNHLFVYPLHLSYDSQKIFSRARNLAVIVELRDSDTAEAKSIECIYGRPGQDQLVSQMACPVLHHNTSPTWYEEIKLRLPLNITAQHHLLFSFFHVSCNIAKKKDLTTTSTETPVGFAWLPLLSKGKINVEEQCLPVAASLPIGYLSIQPLGLGRGNAGPDVQWIDNQRPIFTISLRLDSTVLTTDQHLHNLFLHAERLLEHSKTVAPPDTTETCKILKAAHAIQIGSLITFLPTILNQLFSLLVATNNEEVGLNIIRLLVNLFHMVAEEAKRKELLMAYVKYVYRIDSQPVNGCSPTSQNTVHGELCRHLPTLLHPNNTDFLLVNKFMKFSGIFFEVIVKSMAQYLLSTGRIKMQRNERFPKEFCTRIEALFQVLVPYISSRHKDLPMETEQLNQSLSVFVKRCLSFMDRGFVFRLIRLYMDRWGPGDSRILQEYKFSFLREVCSHEHYIPLNLPFMLTPNNRAPDLLQQFCLSEEYCRQHFLVGILLQEVKSSLNEVSHIRRMGLVTLKELLAKHDLDDRYQNKGQLSRLAMLYVPWLGIVLENLNRISDGMDRKGKHDPVGTNRMSCSSSYVFARDSLPTLPTATPSTVTSQTSTPKSRSNRVTMFIEYTSPIRSSLHLKDTSFLAAIAGQSAALSNGHSSSSLNSECSTLSQDGTVVIRNQFNESCANSTRPSHARSVSVTQPTIIQRTDKFSVTETKDLLISFLFVVKHLSPEHMIAWWHNCTESETVQFFTVLDLCLLYFRYVGKKHVQVPADGGRDAKSTKAAKASTLPARVLPPSITNGSGESGFESGTLNHTANRENLVEETLRLKQALYESNLATEIGLVVLDCMGLYSVQFRESMIEGTVLPKIARVYLRFLQLGQSESLSKHVFAALRAFINNFSQALFKGTAVLCGQLVYELLKCCDSRLSSLRQEACAVLYLLMRSNFEFSGRKGLTRVHLQVIISVSQMIGNVIGLNNARFQESLSTINNYASSDKAMKGTGFPMEVKDLTRRVRTVLMATAQMQAHHMDPERLLELQHSLANSYASTPELRQTWLTTMANNHLQNGNISEAACCYLHIAALVSEYLKLKGCCPVAQGAESFARISRNIPRDEKGLKLDSGTQDSQYTEQFLLERLKECAEYLDRSERLECLGELYRLIIPILESRRDYHGLTQCYEHLTQAYNRVIEFNKSGKRLLGRFYRVIFFSQVYFEEENGVEYIYKEPKVTSLSEISERLHKQYRDKFGADNVKILMDSAPVDQSTLDPKIAYIQVTHVTPYYCKDELEMRPTEFEQNHDVDTFMYETPFTPSGAAHGAVEDQWKRRTVLTTLHSFPYVLKRIPVRDRQSQELSPIEVAIDEMQTKIAELEEIVMGPIDLKKLQLRLQGSVAVTVNAGPLAYATAFLDPAKTISKKYPLDKVEDLKEVFRDFIKICYTVLQINANLISSDQREYHNALKENYENLCSALSDLLGEIVYPLDDGNNNAHRHSLALFSAISGAPTNSSTA